MVLKSKVYEIIKIISKIIPLVIALAGTILQVVGVGEATVNMILVILGAIGTFMTGLVELFRANHWRIQTEEAILDLADYDDYDDYVSEEENEEVQ